MQRSEKLQSTKLKLKLVENEKTFRNRFSLFFEIVKKEVDKSEFLRHAKTKTIVNTIHEVLKSSNDLLLIFDQRKGRQSEAIYEGINTHQLRDIDNLCNYCAHLLDIRALLRSSIQPEAEGLNLPSLMNLALLPVYHVQETLELFQAIKEDLVVNRRLVEIFNCNKVIEKLTEELEIIRRVILSIHAEDLLTALDVMSIKSDSSLPMLDSADWAEDVDASTTKKLSETFSSFAEVRSPPRNDETIIAFGGRCEIVVRDSGTQSETDVEDKTAADSGMISDLSAPSQSEAGTHMAELRIEVCIPDSEEPSKRETAQSPTEVGTHMAELMTEVCIPVSEEPSKRETKIPLANPLAVWPVLGGPARIECSRLEGCGVEDNRRSKAPVSRRESKKLIRCEVNSIEMKITELKNDIVSLEKQMVNMTSTESSDISESEDDCTVKEDFPDDFEESGNVDLRPKVDTVCSGVKLRSESGNYDSGIRDRRTKHLVHSTIWQVPLYQEYHELLGATAEETGPAVQQTKEMTDDLGAANVLDVLVDDSRPESGIEMEAEETLDGYYTPMWNNGNKLVESVDYVNMSRTQTDNTLGEDESSSKHYVWKLEEIGACSQSPYATCRYSARDSACSYMKMGRVYGNMGADTACATQDESVYSSVHDIFGAVQVEKEAALLGENCEVIPRFVKNTGGEHRSGWCNIPSVIESGILENMTKQQRHLQEAKYELISSKVSYLKSLSILQAIFIENANLKSLMTPTEWNNLFQFIVPTKQCSEHFLADLLSGWPQDIFMTNQLSVVRQYAQTGLQTYVNYCSNKVTMDQTLANIRERNPKVNYALKKLEQDEICGNNSLESFLVLPIQRITRFPLLVEGIIHRMDSNTDRDFCAWAKTYRDLTLMAKKCNDAVRESQENNKMKEALLESRVECRTMPRDRKSSAFSKSRHGSTARHNRY